MERSHSKKSLKKLPKIIIIEGVWQVGKTKLANYFSKNFDYTIIIEPDHIVSKIKNNISKWYRKKHWERYKRLIMQLNQGKRIVMERSIISNIAFDYAKKRVLPINFRRDLKKIKKLKNLLIIFLYVNKNFMINRVSIINDISVKKQIVDNSKFYQNYLHFYKKILPPLIENKIIFKKVNKGQRFKSFKKIASF